MKNHFIGGLFLILILGSCATTQAINIEYVVPPSNPELYKPKQKLFVGPVSMADGTATAEPSLADLISRNTKADWSKLNQKEALEFINNMQLDHLKGNDFLVALPFATEQTDKNGFVLFLVFDKFYSRVFDESYTSSTNAAVGNYRAYLEATCNGYVFDLQTGQLALKVNHAKTMNQNSGSYADALMMTVQLAGMIAKETIMLVEAKITPHKVTETRKLIIPDSTDIVFQNGKLLAKKGKFADAYQLFKDVFDSSQRVEAGYNAALLLVAQKKYTLARELLVQLQAISTLPEIKAEIDFIDSLVPDLQLNTH